jgi:hypothetical protein
VEGEDRLPRTDLENINEFTHKEWKPDVLENEIPASLEFVNRNPRLYVLLSDEENTDQINRTATAETGKLVISEVCTSPWIVNVLLSMRVRTPDVRVFIAHVSIYIPQN